jgi:hypothetical protein
MTLEEDILQAVNNAHLVHPRLLDVDAKIIASAAAKIARERIKEACIQFDKYRENDAWEHDYRAKRTLSKEEHFEIFEREYLKENGLL